MANTYSQVYLQFVFAVKGRQNLIPQKHEDELQKYIAGFGYGVFSYSRSQLDNVTKYIMSQKEHHKKQTFKEELLEF